MEESTTREKVLKAIRNALIEPSESPFPYTDFESSIFVESKDLLEVVFADEFTKVGGVFVYCENQNEFERNFKSIISQKQWETLFCFEGEIQEMLKNAEIAYSTSTDNLNQIQIGITPCEFLLARTGSIMISTRNQTGRRLHAIPDVHIVVAKSSQIVNDLKDAFKIIKQKNENLPSMISVITGASRTADIEKTLVMGAHGPRELYVFFIDEF